MKWKVSRVSIPVFDLKESIKFYNFILGKEIETEVNDLSLEDEYFIHNGDIELRLYKLKKEFNNHHLSQSRRTFPTLAVNNLDLIIASLDKEKIDYFPTKKNKSIIIQEPGLNFIELIQLDMTSESILIKDDFSWKFHHINLECYDVRSSVNFISQNLKMEEGAWKAPAQLGEVNINSNQLAIFDLDQNHSGIHINKADFTFSMRNNFIHNPTIGGHPAFSVKNIKSFMAKLETAEVSITDAKIYAMPNIHQIYFYDPNANIIEVNQIIDN